MRRGGARTWRRGRGTRKGQARSSNHLLLRLTLAPTATFLWKGMCKSAPEKGSKNKAELQVAPRKAQLPPRVHPSGLAQFSRTAPCGAPVVPTSHVEEDNGHFCLCPERKKWRREVEHSCVHICRGQHTGTELEIISTKVLLS